MTAITWNGLQTICQAIIARTPYPYTVTDGAFQTLFPQATSYAENRIYRDIPMLAQEAQDTSLITTAGSRVINLGGTELPLLVPERIALITPSTAGSPMIDGFGNVMTDANGNVMLDGIAPTLQSGTQVQYIPVSLAFIDMCWPQQYLTASPANAIATYFALRDAQTAIIAPTPDSTYTVVTTGLFQQIPMSNSNQTTYLGNTYPELLTAACMIFLSGALLRNYGAAGSAMPDEPGMPVHWEGQYQELKTAAEAEELRRRQFGTNWMDKPPMPQMPPAPRPRVAA